MKPLFAPPSSPNDREDPAAVPADGFAFSAQRRLWLRQAGLAAASPWLASWAGAQTADAPTATAPRKPTALVLSYQRFAEKADDARTVRRATLAEHMKALKDVNASVINMVDLVAHHAGRLADLPPRPVVLCVDDCHRSIVDILMKMLHGSAWQVSLYITPDNVGKDKQSLSWDDLSGLHHSGRFSVQARTLSGGDLVKARQGRSPQEFAKYARNEMKKGKQTVENRLVKPISFQAWPDGAFDKELMDIAEDIGFQASMALGNRPASLADPIQAISRVPMHDGIGGKQLAALIKQTFPG